MSSQTYPFFYGESSTCVCVVEGSPAKKIAMNPFLLELKIVLILTNFIPPQHYPINQSIIKVIYLAVIFLTLNLPSCTIRVNCNVQLLRNFTDD